MMKSKRFFLFMSFCVVAMLLLTGVTVNADSLPKPVKKAGGGDKNSNQGPQAGSAVLGGASPFMTPLQKGDDPAERLALDRIQWLGETPDLETLKGKTVIVFFYATWCPKCNEWSGEYFEQMMMALDNRPVVVLAVNADSNDPTINYVKQRNFNAPNILHGYDPSLPMRLGYKSNLFSYVWIGPDGLVREEGYLGTSKFVNPEAKKGPKIYMLPKKLHEAEELGTFDLIRPEFPREAAALLWPLELGQPIDGSLLMKAGRLLKGEQKAAFETAINGYLDARLEKIKTLSAGSVAERLEAYAMAEPFVKQFRAYPQAKPAREILDVFKKDREFKKEIAAQKLYDKATAKGLDPKRRQGMLRGLVRRFEGTYYATKAAEEVQ